MCLTETEFIHTLLYHAWLDFIFTEQFCPCKKKLTILYFRTYENDDTDATNYLSAGMVRKVLIHIMR